MCLHVVSLASKRGFINIGISHDPLVLSTPNIPIDRQPLKLGLGACHVSAEPILERGFAYS